MWTRTEEKPTDRTTALLQAILKRLIRLETKLHKVAQAQGVNLDLVEDAKVTERELLE